MIAMATPISSPTGASCSEARSIRMPRAATSTPPPLRGLGRLEQRLAVGLVEVGGIGRVAHVDRREPAVGRQRAAAGERVGDHLDAVELAHLVERAGDRRARLGVGDLAVLDAEDERRVAAGERRRVRLEEVERLLRLGARDREVVGGFAARAGGYAEQDDDEEGAREAALPMLGEGAGEPRKQGGHSPQITAALATLQGLQNCNICSNIRHT